MTGVRIEHAPPDERFTTYNFAVADFATYFAGQSGVWVHNEADRFCGLVYSAFRQARKQIRAGQLPDGIDPGDAGKSVHFTSAKWSADNVANIPKQNVANLYAEAFDDLVREGEPGWLNYFEGRSLPTHTGATPRVGHTIAKHVGKSDADLIWRFNNEPVSAASSFPDQATAEAATELFIDHYRAQIIRRAQVASYGDKSMHEEVDLVDEGAEPTGKFLLIDVAGTDAVTRGKIVSLLESRDPNGVRFDIFDE